MSGHYSANSYSREWKAPSWANQPDRTVPFPGGEDELGAKLESINWTSQSLVKFNKNFYKENPAASARSDLEVQKIREEMGITVSGISVPKPILSFEESSFPEYILKTLYEAKFLKPTPIQCQGKV